MVVTAATVASDALTAGPVARPRLAIGMAAAMQAVGGGLGWSLLPATMTLVAKELSLSKSMGQLIWGAASLGIAVSAPLGGAAVDRFGPRRVAGFAMLVGAVACALRAAATDAWSLAGCMLLFGMHIGFVAPAIPKALAGHLPLAKVARANGLALFAYTMGTALVLYVGATELAPALGGWRNASIVAGLAMAVTGLVWLGVMRDRFVPARHASLRDGFALLRIASMRRVALMHFLVFGGYIALLGLLPRALLAAGVKPAAVGATVAAWLVAAGVANFGGPWLSDRLGRRRRPLFLVGGLVAGLALGLLALAPSDWAIPLLVLAALGGGSFAPLLLTQPLEIEGVGAARFGGALGLLMLVGQLGGFLLPLLSGVLADGAGGFALAIGALAVCHLLVVVPAWGLRETRSL
ncbi:MAG: MFS transporter [Myxococcota bacterium]